MGSSTNEAAFVQSGIQELSCADSRLGAAIPGPGPRGNITQGAPRRIQERLPLLRVQGSSIPWSYLINLSPPIERGQFIWDGRDGE